MAMMHTTAWGHRIKSFLVFILLVVIGSAWACAVPLRSQADETAHATNAAAVARGQLIVDGTPAIINGSMPIVAHYVEVPKSFENVQDGAGCLFFAPDKAQDCVTPIPDNAKGTVSITTSAANYPPLYYLAIGWPTLLVDGPAAWYLMRLLTVIICAAFYSFGISKVARFFGWPCAIATLAALTPTSLSYMAAINPAGPEIATCFALACALVAVVYSRDLTARNVLAVGVVAAFAIQTRPPAPFWVALVGIAGFALLKARRLRELVVMRSFWGALGVIAASLFAFVLWDRVAEPGKSVLGYPQPTMTIGGMLDWMKSARGQFLESIIGDFGWNDVIVPNAVALAVVGIFALVIFGAQILGDWQERYILLVAIIVIPLTGIAIQWHVLDTTGLMWQGRYWLPLIAAVGLYCCCIVFAHVSGNWRHIWSAALTLLFIFAHSLMFFAVVHRYANGYSSPLTTANFTSTTWLGAVLMVVACIGFSAFAIFSHWNAWHDWRNLKAEEVNKPLASA